ncbi:MAG: GNAT family N-acetyltransferase [Bacteroidetes bacterium]|nr:MAG: GNAT family N-acetyltransferase [Bacteroidota bacterium]MBL1144221.1 GNAT family N-acetyltransferase [Bacteroidota bacterium]NOG57017.1 GNAT family N-acetyltransferase [Bacteroidota bacterium]
MPKLTVQFAKKTNLAAILKLFKRSVLAIDESHYTLAQKKAWAKSSENIARWKTAIENQFFLLAYIEQELVGFIALENNKHIDLIYVCPLHSRMGIAQELINLVEKQANYHRSSELTADVSKAAITFFQKNGFQIITENHNKRYGEILVNYSVSKKL